MNVYALGTVWFVGQIVGLIGTWLCGSAINWALAVKTNAPNKWLAWVPAANMWIYGKTIRFNAVLSVGLMLPFTGNVLNLFIPSSPIIFIFTIVGGIILLVATVRLFHCFGKSPANIWWILLPVVGTILFLVKYYGMIFSKNVPYIDRYDQSKLPEERTVLTATESWNILGTALALAIVSVFIGLIGSGIVMVGSMQNMMRQLDTYSQTTYGTGSIG